MPILSTLGGASAFGFGLNRLAAAIGALTDEYWANTVLLLNADGASDGGQNNTFLDTSTNGHSITRNGNVTQGSFSPFSQDEGKWGNYFDGSDYLSFSGITFNGDFSAECWFYKTANPANYSVIFGGSAHLGVPNVNNHQFSVTNTGGVNMGLNATVVIASSGTAVVSNQWNHIAWVRQGTGSNNCAIFVNGIRQATGTSTENASICSRIGTISNLTGYSPIGYISNARITVGATPYDPSQTTISVPTQPLTAISGTSLLTCQSNRFVDNSSNAHSLTVNGNTKVVPFSPFPQTTAYTPSVVNQGSVKFDGSGDSLSVSGVSAFGTDDVTIEMWFYPTNSSASYRALVDTRSTVNTNTGFAVFYYERKIEVYGDGLKCASATNAFEINQWVHIALVRNSGSCQIYINGTASGSAGTYSNDLTSTVRRLGQNVTGANDITGYVSNYREASSVVYTSDFTVPTAPLEDITNTSLLTCQDGAFRDNSSNTHSITVNGDPKITTFVPFGERSVEFDGTGDKLTVASDTSLQLGSEANWTIEMWAQLVSTPTNFDVILGKGNSGTFEYFIEGFSDRTIDFLYSNNGSPWTGQHQITPAMTLGEWFHLAVVRDGVSLKSYVNGVEYFSGSAGDIYVGSGLLGVGGYAYSTQDPNVILSNVRIVKGTSVYTADFAPPQEPLTAITNTSLLTCQNAVFQDNSGNAHAITVNGDPQPSTNLPFGERSVAFDGSGDYLDTPSDSSFTFGTGDFTVEFWINTTSTGFNIMNPTTATGTGYWGLFVQSGNLRWNNSYNVANLWQISANAILNGYWNHVAISRESGSTKIFYNGVLQSTQADTTDYSGTSAWRIGSGNLASFAGSLSNFRVVKGTAVYTAAFTPPTEPLTAVSGTSLLTCQDAVFQDNSGNAHAITVNGNAKATTNIPFDAVTYGVEQYLDDAYTVSPQGGSGYFDGGDYLRFDSVSLSGDFTIETWFNQSSADGQYVVLVAGSTGTYNFPLIIDYTNAGTVGFYLPDTTAISNKGSYNLNEWNHIALTRSGTTLKLFLNGVEVGTATSSTTLTLDDVGGRSRDNSNNRLDGYMSDTRIINGTALYTSDFTPPTAPLTPTIGTSLLTNFTNASIYDATGKNVLETVGNAQIDTTTVKYGTGAIEALGNGNQALVRVQNKDLISFGTGDFTVEYWLYTTSTANQNPPFSFDWTTGNGGWYFGHKNSGGKYLVFGVGTTPYQQTWDWQINTWYHVAVTRSGTNLKLFVDGTQLGSTMTSSDNVQAYDSTLRIGTNSEPNTVGFSAYIDDFRITKGIARYTANFTPPTAELPVVGE